MSDSVVGKEIKNYPKKTFDHAVAAVDVVLLRLHKKELQVLLLELKEEPFAGKWALPGGLVTHRENLDKAALRHLENKINLKNEIFLEQLYSFGDPKRDPLGWVVSVAYLGLTNKPGLRLKAAKRYKSLKWINISSLSKFILAYDHEKIVKTAVKRLISKINYTNIIQYLVKEEFTLTQLQKAYELLLNKELDKRNFRKKILSTRMVKALSKSKKAKTKRPAMLYSFTSRRLTSMFV